MQQQNCTAETSSRLKTNIWIAKQFHVWHFTREKMSAVDHRTAYMLQNCWSMVLNNDAISESTQRTPRYKSGNVFYRISMVNVQLAIEWEPEAGSMSLIRVLFCAAVKNICLWNIRVAFRPRQERMAFAKAEIQVQLREWYACFKMIEHENMRFLHACIHLWTVASTIVSGMYIVHTRYSSNQQWVLTIFTSSFLQATPVGPNDSNLIWIRPRATFNMRKKSRAIFRGKQFKEKKIARYYRTETALIFMQLFSLFWCRQLPSVLNVYVQTNGENILRTSINCFHSCWTDAADTLIACNLMTVAAVNAICIFA